MGAHRVFYCDGLQVTNGQLTGCLATEGRHASLALLTEYGPGCQ